MEQRKWAHASLSLVWGRKIPAIGKLLLEEILEGLARVVGTPRSGSNRGSYSVVHQGRIFFDGHAEFEKRAIVFRVFFGDALGDRLRAFKLLAGIEVNALFAAVQLGVATRTLTIRIEARHQHRAATGTARPHHGSHHAGGSRAHHFLLGAGLALGTRVAVGAVSSVPFLVFGVAVAVAPLLILPVHRTS